MTTIRIERLIVALFASVLSIRGLVAIWLGEYWITTRNHPPRLLEGAPARFAGTAYLGLAVLVLGGYVLARVSRRGGLAIMAAGGALALAAFAASLYTN